MIHTLHDALTRDGFQLPPLPPANPWVDFWIRCAGHDHLVAPMQATPAFKTFLGPIPDARLAVHNIARV
ncbi:hypothetical protein H257_16258 [Aphanomyces astaci]|uniref:Uncharacterized protein n=1 Tax=Aphanomyces astaci TaxID=112090 RepID=W4FJ47_APHAT|nr:hypothetical protein H257_16258 [Aphanomyces astaci]ETV67527.1 hypothetical protein H257_16258 [Aphanomyces astaci]|eukprot:XP_009842931.1 hypothetical protein H257_16258 [Aphanomyces astaci]